MDPITELLDRTVTNIIPSKSSLETVLRSNQKLNVYLGIDPTSTHIHLGHAVNLRQLQRLVDLGHNVTFLIGDFTAKVGDNSDKETERPILTDTQITENFQTYKTQAEKFLDFSKVKLRHNSEWLSPLVFQDILKLCQHFTLNDYLSREIMKKKLDKGVSVRLDELLYPLMQGWDSYTLDTDLQIGAADQTFNMQAGRTLQKQLRNKESFILVNKYLTGTDGRKMSKSWGNAIWLDDLANDVYGKIMSIKDDLIDEYFLLATSLPKSKFAPHEPPLARKHLLAWQIVHDLHSKTDADKAKQHFVSTVQKKELPQNMPTYSSNATVPLMVASGSAISNSDARRKIDQGGVINKILGDQGEVIREIKVASYDYVPQPGTVISVGNRHHIKIKD